MSNGASLRPDDVVQINPLYLFRWEEPQQAHVLLYPEGLVKLNATAGEILTMVDGRVRVGEIVDRLAAKYDAPDIAADVLEFLEISHAKGWIRTKP